MLEPEKSKTEKADKVDAASSRPVSENAEFNPDLTQTVDATSSLPTLLPRLPSNLNNPFTAPLHQDVKNILGKQLSESTSGTIDLAEFQRLQEQIDQRQPKLKDCVSCRVLGVVPLGFAAYAFYIGRTSKTRLDTIGCFGLGCLLAGLGVFRIAN